MARPRAVAASPADGRRERMQWAAVAAGGALLLVAPIAYIMHCEYDGSLAVSSF
jgi:hypothetical protein